MQITVDSTDRLQDVLRLVGSLYDVELTVAAGGTAEAAAGQNGARKRASAKGGAAAGGPRRRTRRAANRADTPDLAAVRAWAREHGHQVSDRGRVPNAVLDAYKESAQAG